MPEFFSAFSRPKTLDNSSGNEFFISFRESIDPKTGVGKLVESGRQSIREYIESSFDETKIDTILSRCARGDISALQRVAGQYADLSTAPECIHELKKFIDDARASFDNLPVDLKSEFGNSPEQFVASFSNGQFNKFLDKKGDLIDKSKSGKQVQPNSAGEHTAE